MVTVILFGAPPFGVPLLSAKLGTIRLHRPPVDELRAELPRTETRLPGGGHSEPPGALRRWRW